MELQLAQFVNKGMNQDISISKASNEFAFRNHNIRLTAINDRTLLSITNEKGPLNIPIEVATEVNLIPNKFNCTNLKEEGYYTFSLEYPADINVVFSITSLSGNVSTYSISAGERYLKISKEGIEDFNDLILLTDRGDKYIYYVDTIPEDTVAEYTYIQGKYVGSAILNDTVVLFTAKEKNSYIYALTIGDTVKGILKYVGELGFSENHKIETVSYYVSEDIQKVYWCDGINNVRSINIKEIVFNKPTSYFDFTPEVEKFPAVYTSLDYSGSGLFPSGVIQYYLSYYNKYGSETGVVAASSLTEIKFEDRGASPDESVTCNIELTISDIDHSFEYLRVYSVHRSSIDGPADCKIVSDVKISDSDTITIVDTNSNNTQIDSTVLLFLGGDSFTASTLAHKDSTLFFGDITLNDHYIIEKEVRDLLEPVYDGEHYTSPYLHFKKIRSSRKHFKNGEWYRIGIQFQTSTAKWTAPMWMGDILCTSRIGLQCQNGKCWRTVPILNVEFTDEVIEVLNKYYSNYRLLMAEPSTSDRSVLAQGFVSPTVFNWNERVKKTGPYAIGSWVARAVNGGGARGTHLSGLGNSVQVVEDTINYFNDTGCEIQNTITKCPVAQSISKNYLYCFHRKVWGYGRGGEAYAEYKLSIYELSSSFSGDTESLTKEHISKLIKRSSIYTTSSDYYEGSEEKYYYDINTFFSTFNLPYLDISFDQVKPILNTKNSDYKGFGIPISELPGWYTGYISDDNSDFQFNENVSLNNGAFIIVESERDVSYEMDNNNNYYVDASILTFHSPDIEDINISSDTSLKLRFVGYAPIEEYYQDIILETSTEGASKNSTLNKSNWSNRQFGRSDTMLINGPVYSDYAWNLDGKISKTFTNYYAYLWNKSGSIIGQTTETKDSDGNAFAKELAKLQHKVIANKRKCESTLYISDSEYYDIEPIILNSDTIESKYLSNGDLDVVYQGNYENVVTTDSEFNYRVFWAESGSGIIYDDYLRDVEQYDPVHIKYTKLPHIAFTLIDKKGNRSILPAEGESKKWKIQNIYPEIGNNKVFYPWLSNEDSYVQHTVEGINEDKPYFFVAELYRDTTYSSLYGGTEYSNIQNINWLPITDPTRVFQSTTADGDTYYKRWECLNTVPTTETDLNSVVDIVSLLLETRVNLDGRYDKNQDSTNILNARKNNFNLINKVYSQKDNYFQYNIIDNSLSQKRFSNQILFSLTKEPNSIIDTWTSINLSSAFNVDGTYGKINKIINFNDTLLAFQDKALSVIDFNNKTALSTETGVPIEIANSGRVNGFTTISSSVGCSNKDSICLASSGLYFIDDLNKSLFRFNKEGLSNLSAAGLSIWFKENLTGHEQLFYDSITQDVYIVNDLNCLLYNEGMQSFTSFMDYQGMSLLFNMHGNSFVLNKEESLKVYKMFAGEYNTTFNSNKHQGYFIEYKINPEPISDKIFSSIEYLADCFKSGSVDTLVLKDEEPIKYPFDTLEVWNEYQKGTTTIKDRYKYPNFEKKFRIWRVDIPRDDSNKRDRIRNPWAYIRLSKSPTDNYKTIFHNLIVKYYK